ncbi:hypothetical protein DCAR_0104426 [Daucus carota subsp. sativus]|uniref:LysM domain-containing protein n=1 Tax=Daucus carota subsp. sativus TaxID=79200 RepID=A0AAF0WBS2_DAUCS|nr:hypothetical protein DCAR_0104426 [Daucus carota subsp. sativus]
MANPNNNSRASLFALALALFLLIAVAQSKPGYRTVPVPAGPTCDTVFGVRKGDTCFDIGQNFKLSAHDFNCINPNVNCAALFVGQWVCISGTA